MRRYSTFVRSQEKERTAAKGRGALDIFQRAHPWDWNRSLEREANTKVQSVQEVGFQVEVR